MRNIFDGGLKLPYHHYHSAENEQSMHKKDGEGSSPTGPRDRRSVLSSDSIVSCAHTVSFSVSAVTQMMGVNIRFISNDL